MNTIRICLAAVVLLTWGCTDTSIPENDIILAELSSPVGHGGEPNLHVMEDGRPILSWVEYVNDTVDALMFSVLNDGKWSKGKIIAEGSDWFVNWADFPSMAVFAGSTESMAAHWLQKSAQGIFDYDVRVAQSNDGGNSWGKSFVVHRDGIAAEHGFVTMIPVSEDRIFATWLDGRNTKGKENRGHNDHAHHGAMSLRAAEFDRNGNLYKEVELDAKTCDCCQTDAAMTSQGMVVVYRDRSDDEVRDISIVREHSSAWTEPVAVHNDGWEIAGCPVNGPAIDARSDFVALAWHTEAGDKPKVLVSYSVDAGVSFSPPVSIGDHGTLGRVDICILDNETTFVTWLEKRADGARIMGAHLDENGNILSKSVLTTTDAGRRSGFPVLDKTRDGLMLAWTQVTEEETSVRTGIIRFDQLLK